IANRGNDMNGANYTGFRLGSDGQLSPLAGSTIPLSAVANVGGVFFSATGGNLIGTEVGSDEGPFLIDSFVVGSDGRLTPAPGSPFAAQAAGPYAGAFGPTEPNHLIVVNTANSSISRFAIEATGALTLLGNTILNDPTNLRAIDARLDPAGHYLYVLGADAGV